MLWMFVDIVFVLFSGGVQWRYVEPVRSVGSSIVSDARIVLKNVGLNLLYDFI